MPPSLFMYDTTVVLSVATGTIVLSKGLGTLLKPERTALSFFVTSWGEALYSKDYVASTLLVDFVTGRLKQVYKTV